MTALHLRDLPELPADSVIEVEETDEGLVLCWHNPRGGAGRYRLAAFILVPLTVFVSVFGVLAGHEASKMISGEKPIACPAVAFFVFCAGAAALLAYCVLMLLLPRRAEVLTLTGDTLLYRRGTPPVGQRKGNTIWGSHVISWEPFGRRPRICAQRAQVIDVNLLYLGGREGLTVEIGTKRVEIGRYLSEPEREWLADVLRLWLGRG